MEKSKALDIFFIPCMLKKGFDYNGLDLDKVIEECRHSFMYKGEESLISSYDYGVLAHFNVECKQKLLGYLGGHDKDWIYDILDSSEYLSNTVDMLSIDKDENNTLYEIMLKQDYLLVVCNLGFGNLIKTQATDKRLALYEDLINSLNNVDRNAVYNSLLLQHYLKFTNKL